MMKGMEKSKEKIVGDEMSNVKAQISNQTKTMSKPKA